MHIFTRLLILFWGLLAAASAPAAAADRLPVFDTHFHYLSLIHI